MPALLWGAGQFLNSCCPWGYSPQVPHPCQLWTMRSEQQGVGGEYPVFSSGPNSTCMSPATQQLPRASLGLELTLGRCSQQ